MTIKLRLLRMGVAAVIATALAILAAAVIGGSVLVVAMLALLPAPGVAPWIGGIFLLGIFGFVFVVVYSEMMEKLAPFQSQDP